MIRRLNESRKDEILKMADTYSKYIIRCKNILDSIERNWGDFVGYLENTNGSNHYYDDIDSFIYELSKAFTGLNRLETNIRSLTGKPYEKVWENKKRKRRKDIKERIEENENNRLYGVRVYDPYSGEYVVFWSEKKNIVSGMANTLKDNLRIESEDISDFAYQINPLLFNHVSDDYEWDFDDYFVDDGVTEDGDVIDIIYEFPYVPVDKR